MSGANPDAVFISSAAGEPEPLIEKRSEYTTLHYYMSFFCFVSFGVAVITSFGPDPIGVLVPASEMENGCDGIDYCICPREAVCAESVQEIIYLAIARTSIYAVYPFILLLFLSKANHLVTLLQSSVFSVWIDFPDLHHLHVVGGKVVELATWVHVFFHCLRWGIRSEMDLLVNHVTGLTGLVATIVMPFITWPMLSEYLRKRLCFEYRKGLHYLSWVWGLALVFHAPAVNIFYVVGSAMLVYLLNYFLGMYFKTFLVPSTIFRKLDTGVSLSFYNPNGFELKGASYVVVMLPWISTLEWHAFSIFPHPTEPDHSSLCIAAIGDWSKKLHQTITRPTVRPAWICGPFLSPFATAHDYDNIITLATGIGITPALAVMNMFKETRRVNLVWMCRDPSLIEYFVNAVPFPDDSFVLIYYTGKAKLLLAEDVPPNVFLFKGRPILDKVITGMIHCIESRQGLPEEIVDEGKSFSTMPPVQRFLIVLSRVLATNSPTEFSDLCIEASIFSAAERQRSSKRSRGFGDSTKSVRPTLSFLRTSNYSSIRQSVRHIERVITKEGLLTGLNEYIGRHDFDMEDMDAIFMRFDKNRDGVLNRSEFTNILVTLDEDGNSQSSLESESEIEKSKHIKMTRRASWTEGLSNTSPSKARPSSGSRSSIPTLNAGHNARATFAPEGISDGHADAVSYLKKNAGVLKTWEMLYCGGSAPVVANLKDVSNKYNIDLRIEKFDW